MLPLHNSVSSWGKESQYIYVVYEGKLGQI